MELRSGLGHTVNGRRKKAAFRQFHRRRGVAADGRHYMGHSINTEDHHYIEWYTWDHTTDTRGALVSAELYDRKSDPHEKNNLAVKAKYGELAKSLSKQLAEGWRKAVPDCQ